MSAWWSKTADGVKKHDGRQPKLAALIRCSFARSFGQDVAALAIYRRDPDKHPDEPNVFAEMLDAADRKRVAAEVNAILKPRRCAKVST